MAIVEDDVMSELTRFGWGFVGMLAGSFRQLANFVEWAVGVRVVDVGPHTSVIGEVPQVRVAPMAMLVDENANLELVNEHSHPIMPPHGRPIRPPTIHILLWRKSSLRRALFMNSALMTFHTIA